MCFKKWCSVLGFAVLALCLVAPIAGESALEVYTGYGSIFGAVYEDPGLLDTPTDPVIPIAGAQVFLYYVSPAYEILYETTTNEDGIFLFAGIPAGQVEIFAYADGHEEGSASVHLQTDATATAIILLEPIVQESGTLSGTVIVGYDDGDPHILSITPIAGAVVSLMPAAYPEDGLIPPEPALWAETDEHGHYLIEDIPSDLYIAVVEAEGFESQSVDVEIPAGHEIVLDFELYQVQNQEGRVEGLIYEKSNWTDPADPGHGSIPIPGAQVTLVSEGATDVALTTYADEEGHYAFDGVSPGEYRLIAEAHGYESGETYVGVAGGETTVVNVALKPITQPGVGSLSGVVYALAHNSYINGTIAPFPRRIPIAGATVRIMTDSTNVAAVFQTMTDRWGRYRIEGIPAGQHVVVAGKRWQYSLERRIVQIHENEEAVLDIRLQRSPGPIIYGGQK